MKEGAMKIHFAKVRSRLSFVRSLGFIAIAVAIGGATAACQSVDIQFDGGGSSDGGQSGSDSDLGFVFSYGDLCVKPHSEAITPAGGRLVITMSESPALSGTTLVVPPGALNGAASLQLGCGKNLAGADEVAVGPSLRLSPEGLTFLTPVTLTIPYSPTLIPSDGVVSVAVQTGSQRTLLSGADLTVNAAAGTVTLPLAHFSDYQVIASKPRPPTMTNNVDVLFVMDNSPSMTPKQKALAKNIPLFISGLDAAGLDYHIAIISTDIGTNTAPGTPWGASIGKCDTYVGDDGVMQTSPCTSHSDVTSDAKNACSSLCPDDKYVPNDGKRFLSKVGGVTNVPVALELDPMSGKMVDRGPIHAFQCMALLGDSGCGVESPLESVHRALDAHRGENSGFLRPDSLLAIVFLTDEDDCSVQLARRSENNPTTRDCDPAQPDTFDCYNLDYRCLARSVTCDQVMDTPGTKTNCKERPGNYLEPVSKYATFLRGLRPAGRLLLSGIWTLPSIDKGGVVSIARGSGGTTTPFLNRAPGSGASCSYSGDAAIFGQAQLRLSSFAAGFTDAQQYSICDLDGLPANLDLIIKAIAAKARK